MQKKFNPSTFFTSDEFTIDVSKISYIQKKDVSLGFNNSDVEYNIKTTDGNTATISDELYKKLTEFINNINKYFY